MSTQGIPRAWGHRTELSDTAIQQAAFNIVGVTMLDLRGEFEKARVINGWPADAKPTWQIGWIYLEETE